MTKPKSLYESNNPESWQWITRFYEDMAARPHWRRLLPLLQLVKQVAASEYAQSFRAGQSLDGLMISTAARHGLGPSDAYVFVKSQWNSTLFRVEYWPGDDRGECVEGYTCAAEELWDTLTPPLRRLWHETRGEDAA